MTFSWIRSHRDLTLGVGVGALYLIEVLLRAGEPARLLALIPVLVAGIALRRKAAILGLALTVGALLLNGLLDPGFAHGGGLTFLIAWFLAHYAVGRWTRGWLAWLGPLIVVGTTALLFVFDGNADPTNPGDLAYFLSICAVPWGVGVVTRLRSEHLAALRADNERLELEQEEIARRAVTEERARIARELHDVVSHAISVTVLQARGARRTLGVDDQLVRRALDAIEQTNTAALGDMRRLLAVLRDTEDEPGVDHRRAPQPSLANLGLLVEQVAAAGLVVDLEVQGTPTHVPPGVDLSAYRIVQEALTNVLRHSGSATARLCVRYAPDELEVVVRDNGAGARAPSGVGAGSGHGLIGIRERVAVVGGEVTAGPCTGGGFQVRARIPYFVEAS